MCPRGALGSFPEAGRVAQLGRVGNAHESGEPGGRLNLSIRVLCLVAESCGLQELSAFGGHVFPEEVAGFAHVAQEFFRCAGFEALDVLIDLSVPLAFWRCHSHGASARAEAEDPDSIWARGSLKIGVARSLCAQSPVLLRRAGSAEIPNASSGVF